MEKSGRKGFSDYCPAEKSMHFFGNRSLQKNVRERAMPEKKSKKGLIAKISANNLCQRKLL
jgi:hypothetical protein